ncbi:rho GTPase-activating protein 23-like isoform X3 [Choristoneura fumiferana]|uniref:rho GTPase-activating protein 23-like isoform X3 n=1 Tax=Choristoneura fumiferana TaxID=7141 RepID=UPI003D153E36
MMQGLLESLYKIYTDWRAPMGDESEGRARRAPAPPPRQPARPPEPRSRSDIIALPAPPRLIRPSEHLALVEWSERRHPPLVPTVTVIQGPRPTLPPPPVHRPVAPPQPRMPAPTPPSIMRLPQPRRDIQPPPVVHVPLALPPPTSAPAPPAALAAAPRTIVIQRPDSRHGFGFTLRHLVVYPPDSLQDLYEDARHLAVGAVGAPMDTIFVRSVRPGGPAAAAGLRAGDRVLAVNGEPVACGRGRAPYARVVQLAQREPFTLRLTVVPRDHDLLQRYFSEAAYNPESNQRHIEMPAPITEHESRLFDAYRRPRAALPAPQTPGRREDPEYASVASLAPTRYDAPRLPATPHHLLHDGRRESDTSLPSSATESKDSLGSFDSNSTLTGRELDDSIILSRIRKSLEQKEAFLRRPSQPTGWVTPDVPPPIKQKEFYARPQKLQKPAWPPPASPPLAASPPPLLPQQNQEQKKDDCSASVDSGTFSGYGEVNGTHNEKQRLKPDKSQFVTTLSKIQETTPSNNNGSINNGSSPEYQEAASTSNHDSRYPIPELQLVTARTRQLEEARGGGERRTEVARSELARLTTTRLEPSVALRRKEFETRTARREARSLDVQPQQDLEHEIPLGGSSSLSGNQLMITGSKYLHCPPPEKYVPETEKVQMRTRSNSTGSEGLPIRRHHATDGSHAKRRMGLNREQMEAMNRVSLPGAMNGLQGDGPQRPTQLSLAPPSAGSSASVSAATSPASPSPTPSTPADSGFADDLVTRRQKKDAQLGAEEERAMRRVSYLKATWGDRLHLDSDPEPDADHHALRSPDKKGEEGSLESAVEPIEGDVQGNVQIKMVVSNGKRASDRSWKQVWAVLHGAKLHLYRHHPSQSPGAVSGSTPGAESSRDTLDMRYSLAALADDYTKRKHVVRVTTAAGAELLLQAEGPADAQRWLAALRRHSAEPPPAEAAPAPAAECPSPLPPQRSKKIGRNRSPTGPPTPTLPSSPKNKTWKGRMAKQLRRMHGGGAAAAPAPASGWLGAPLERCPADPEHPLVPRAVTLPAHAVEAYGLRTVGVYRVPGNAAGVAALAAALDRGEPPPEGDARWADVHVASSLLKAYLRRLPDPLLTAEMYPAFIAADRSPERARELRRLVLSLPDPHYETLKYLIQHLRRVVAHSSYNKMEARNLAIVFGPTLVRAASDDMLAMVNDMSSQCRIIESFLTHYDWYFEEDEGDPPVEPPPAAEEHAPAPSRDLLIHNVKKIEGKDVSTRDIVSSIISAANRKIQRKPRSKPSTDSKKWVEPDKGRAESSPGASPPNSPLTSPPAHLTTTLADYDGLPHRFSRSHEGANKVEIESISVLGRGRQELSRHTHTLQSFSIDGTGDLVSSLTSTFDQKLRTLNNSSPLDDGSIPYADEPEPDELSHSGKSSCSRSDGSSAGAASERDERVSPAARAQELKAAWLARDHRHSSSSSDEPDRAWPRRADDDDDKENCRAAPSARDDDKDVDTRSQLSETMPDNDKTLAQALYPAPAPAPSYKQPLRLANPECAKRNSAALDDGDKDGDCSKLKRSESLTREPERGAARVLRSESLNCRERPQRSDSVGKGERLSKLEKGEWNVVRRREAAWRSTKLKRKNGMPERGIKRRHTVGGTKDFDKDGWSARHTRTSSPDLTAAAAARWPAPLVPPPRPPLESHV